MPDDERALLNLSRDGDLDAFEHLVRLHQDRVFNVAYRITGNHEDAADAAQEAFLRAYQALPQFRAEAAFGTWLYRIATNTALGEVRRRQISGQDVTEEFIDLEARIRNLERQEARLLAFMDRATRIPDLLAIESEVTRVRGEVERLTGRLRFLANKVDLATVTAEVSQKPEKTPGGLWDFDRTLARIEAAFLNTVRQMLGAVEAIAAFSAAILPLVLLGGLGWIAMRRSARRADRAI